MTSPAREPSAASDGAPRAPRRLLIGVVLFAAVVAAIGYARYGSTEGWTTAPRSPQPPAAAGGGMDPAQIEAMVSRLAARLETQPDDVEGWTMLARSYLVLDRPADALKAFERLERLRPDDAQLKAALVELRGIVAKLPTGTASRAAPGSPMAPTTTSPAAAPPATTAAAAPQVAAASAAVPGQRGRVEGLIELAPALRERVPPGATLFVFAYALDGPRVPLAVMRQPLGAFPVGFALDDAMAMNPAFKLSIAAQVIVGARISASGDAKAQPGDLQGFSAPVPAGSRGVRVVIDARVP